MKKFFSLITLTGLLISIGISSIILFRKDIVENQNNKDIFFSKNDNNLVNNNKIITKNEESKVNFDSKLFSNSLSTNNACHFFSYIDNKVLTDDFTVKIIETLLRSLKFSSLESVKYLSCLKFNSEIIWFINDLTNNWDQESEYGSTTIEAMKNFINSKKGDIAQAKLGGSAKDEGQWHNIITRNHNWNWNDFYLYMAGANFNYMIKVLSGGNYIGELVDKYLKINKWGFDKTNFLNEFSYILNQLETNEKAWFYLIKAIVPVLKYEILNLEKPTIGFKNLTWEKNSDQDLAIENILKKIKYLFSSEGHNDFVKLIANFLVGPFGEDILIDCKIFGYYTFPELLKLVNSWPFSIVIWNGLKPEVIAEKIVDQLTNIMSNSNLIDTIDYLINIKDSSLNDFSIDLKELCNILNKLFLNVYFKIGLNQIIDIINNPDSSQYSLKEILKMWGVQSEEENFRANSVFAIIKEWIADPNSILNKIFNIIYEIINK